MCFLKSIISACKNGAARVHEEAVFRRQDRELCQLYDSKLHDLQLSYEEHCKTAEDRQKEKEAEILSENLSSEKAHKLIEATYIQLRHDLRVLDEKFNYDLDCLLDERDQKRAILHHLYRRLAP